MNNKVLTSFLSIGLYKEIEELEKADLWADGEGYRLEGGSVTVPIEWISGKTITGIGEYLLKIEIEIRLKNLDELKKQLLG